MSCELRIISAFVLFGLVLAGLLKLAGAN